MHAGSFTSADVQVLTSRVVVNGVDREVDSWSIDRDLPSGLPDQVVAVSGTVQATGSIEWATDQSVLTTPPNPWNAGGGWVPSRGDQLQIWVSDGSTEWQQFDGLIDTTRGEIGGSLTSTIIDRYDNFSAPVSHSPLLGIMPPSTISGTGGWRMSGIHPLYYVDLALRRAGFYTTPGPEQNYLLRVPMQGSLWPHYGRLDDTTGTNISGGYNTVTPWGLGKRDFVCRYSPAENPTMSQPMQLSFMVAPGHASATDITVDYGTENFIRASISASRVVTVRRGTTTITSLSLTSADHIVSVMAKNGQISIRTNTGATASGPFSAAGAGMSRVRVNAGTNASIAGLQVSRPVTSTQEHASTRGRLNARLDTTSLVYLGGLIAGPNVEDITAERLISQINDALLASMWIDETGVVQWVQSDTLRRRTSVKTVTTQDDIFSLSWESGLLQSSASVSIEGKRPAVTRSRWRGITVAEGSSSQTLRAGDDLEIFLEAASDEDWILPSFEFLEVGGSQGGWGSFNNPEYGTVGIYFERDGEEISGSVSYNTTITTHQIGNQKTLIKYVAGNWPSNVEGVLATPPDETGFTVLWPRHRNQPVIRQKAMGRVEWYDDRITITGPGGPGPELVHDVGVWSNAGEYASTTNYWQRIGDYIQSQASVPQPVIRGLDIHPDPRLQIGDVITIGSDLIGVKLTALIIGLSQGAAQGGYHQSLQVTIISVDSTSMTYEEFQDLLPGATLTYQQWQTLGPVPQTYSHFNTSSE